MLAKPTSLPPTSDCISLLIDPGKECGSAKDNFNIISLDLLLMKAMHVRFHLIFILPSFFFRLRLEASAFWHHLNIRHHLLDKILFVLLPG